MRLRQWAHYAFLAASIALFLLLVGFGELRRLDLLGFWRSVRAVMDEPIAAVLDVSLEWISVLVLLGPFAPSERHDEVLR